MDPRLALNPSKIGEFRTLENILVEAIKAEELEKFRGSLSASQLKDLALIFNEKSDYAKAQKYFELALTKVSQELLSEIEKRTIISYCEYGLGKIAREWGESSKAVFHFLTAQAILKTSTFSPSEKSQAIRELEYDIQRNLGIAHLKLGAPSAAVTSFKSAMDLATEHKMQGRLPAVKSYYGLSLVLDGKHDEGSCALQEARTLYPKEIRATSMDWATHCYHMGRAYQVTGKHVEAILELDESLKLRLRIDRGIIGPIYFHSRVGDAYLGLAESYLSIGDKEKAKIAFSKALENYKAIKHSQKIKEIQGYLKPLMSSSNSHYLQFSLFAIVGVGAGFAVAKLLDSASSFLRQR